jgi:hypothetical protein
LQEEITRKRAGNVKNFDVTFGTRAGFQEPHQSVSECKAVANKLRTTQTVANTLRIFIPSLFALSLTGNKKKHLTPYLRQIGHTGHLIPSLKVQSYLCG